MSRENAALLVLAGVVVLSSFVPSSIALSSRSAVTTAASRKSLVPPDSSSAVISTLSLDERLLTQQRRRLQTYRSSSGAAFRSHVAGEKDGLEDGDDDDWGSDDDDDDLIELEMRRFRELRDSTGSEVLQSELQAQIDLGADHFLQEHARDATALEKLAMSSVTSQLPQRAVEALARSGSREDGVSHGEEILLARVIQQGATLFGAREKLQAKMGRSPTKQEWADQANLTPKELRRQVSNYRFAKHKLVEANMGLVHAVVNQQYCYYKKSGFSKAELIQEGSLGLLRAAELFDPSRGLRFSTYAVVWVKGTLYNSHITEFVRLPHREKTKYHKILKAQRDMGEVSMDPSESTRQSSTATPERLAAVTGLSVDEVRNTQLRMGQAQRLLSLDYEYVAHSRSGGETSSFSVLERDRSLQADVDLAELTQLRADVLAALARNLDAREARLMRLRYGLSDGHARSLHECAEAMGLSYTRVHQLSNRCLKKLRQAAEVEALEEYLLTIA